MFRKLLEAGRRKAGAGDITRDKDNPAMSTEYAYLGGESRLAVEPFLRTVTTVVLVTFVLRTLLDRQRAARWLASWTGSDRAQAAQLAALMKESRAVELERNKVSAQDQYARWTKLNRRLDKLNDEVKRASQQLQAAQLSHVGVSSTLLLLVEKAPLYVLRSWYARTPVLRLGEETALCRSFGFQRFILNMPFGERNTVSTLFWCTALDLVLQTLLVFAKDFYALVVTISAKPETAGKPASAAAGFTAAA